MLANVKEEVQDLNDITANLSNQLESVRVEDVVWCQLRISALEKPNNPANKSLWQLINHLSCWIKDQDNLIKDLQAGLVGAKSRVSVLEMSSLMICLRVSVLEEVMEINPPVTDLSREDSTNSEYTDVDDGGAMLVDNLDDKRDQENVVPIPIPPPAVHLDTPCLPTILRELIPIEEPAPVGEDDAWYIPPIICHQIHALDEFTTAAVKLVLVRVPTH